MRAKALGPVVKQRRRGVELPTPSGGPVDKQQHRGIGLEVDRNFIESRLGGGGCRALYLATSLISNAEENPVPEDAPRAEEWVRGVYNSAQRCSLDFVTRGLPAFDRRAVHTEPRGDGRSEQRQAAPGRMLRNRV